MLNIVGFGPGGYEYMTNEAVKALEESDLIIGYTTYTELIKPYFPDKEYMATPMMKEVDRCKIAIEESASKNVSLVCSGDSGIYGMASLVYELMEDKPEEASKVNVIAGVTAAASGGSVLGAPLSHDFMTVSLSDLLTPIELIKQRIQAGAMSDMVICIYNPSSKKRSDYLSMACDIVLEYRTESTVCGYVRNIGRADEEAYITTLGELRNTQVDMFTTVYIGNSKTKNINGKMVTPRGYRDV